jgi:subtilisin family serine protease
VRAGQRGARRGITALALSAGLVTTGTITGTTAVAQAGEQSAGQGDRSVTLITGDRVELAGDRVVRFVPGPGRGRLPVRTFTRDGHQHVVPADAIALVDSGKLDPRLFDVTSLAEFGYDDSRRTTIPVLVRPAAGARSGVTALAAKGTVNGLVTGSVEKSGSAWESLRGGAAEKVWLDGVRKVTLDRSTKQIGAPAAWQAGVTGKGVKVAVLDTGVDEKHPDLQGRQIAEKNFTESPDNTDEVGHGTHVASTIAGKGEKYRGVAPDAEILDGKVCHPGGCSESAILGGMQWAAEQGASVINMSLGGGDTPEIDPIEEAVNRISQETGALFVIAAGNSGRPETIGSPGSAESALTVGAVDRNDGIAPFSSRGPAADGAVKPDVTAPGVDIVAAEAGTQGHVSMSGTSMATPHVAGVVALLRQQHPDWAGTRLKATIMASAKANPSLTAFDQGTGRVDVAKMLGQQVIAEPANINFGVQQWPHDDDQKVVREVTYRNPGKEPVTLDLTVDVKGPDGKPSPAGLFTVSPAKVTLPAGGEAKATITADTKANAPDGAYSGAVVASNGLRTLVSVNREVESYDTAVSVLGSDGNPAENHSTVFVNTKTGKSYPGMAKNVRLPKGEYLVDSGIITTDFKVVFQVQPKFQVTGKGSITIDARNAKPVALKTPDAAAKGIIGTVGYSIQIAGRSFGHGWAFFDGLAGQVSTAQIGPAVPGFLTTIAEQFQGTPRDEKTPVSYRLMYTEKGMPTGYERTAKANELAEMTTSFRNAGEDRRQRWLRLVHPGAGRRPRGRPRLDRDRHVELALRPGRPGQQQRVHDRDARAFLQGRQEVLADVRCRDLRPVRPVCARLRPRQARGPDRRQGAALQRQQRRRGQVQRRNGEDLVVPQRHQAQRVGPPQRDLRRPRRGRRLPGRDGTQPRRGAVEEGERRLDLQGQAHHRHHAPPAHGGPLPAQTRRQGHRARPCAARPAEGRAGAEHAEGQARHRGGVLRRRRDLEAGAGRRRQGDRAPPEGREVRFAAGEDDGRRRQHRRGDDHQRLQDCKLTHQNANDQNGNDQNLTGQDWVGHN